MQLVKSRLSKLYRTNDSVSSVSQQQGEGAVTVVVQAMAMEWGGSLLPTDSNINCNAETQDKRKNIQSQLGHFNTGI